MRNYFAMISVPLPMDKESSQQRLQSCANCTKISKTPVRTETAGAIAACSKVYNIPTVPVYIHSAKKGIVTVFRDVVVQNGNCGSRDKTINNLVTGETVTIKC